MIWSLRLPKRGRGGAGHAAEKQGLRFPKRQVSSDDLQIESLDYLEVFWITGASSLRLPIHHGIVARRRLLRQC
jgi:hypothetical protein